MHKSLNLGWGRWWDMFCSFQSGMRCAHIIAYALFIMYFSFSYKRQSFTTNYLQPPSVWLGEKNEYQGKRKTNVQLGCRDFFYNIHYISICMFPALMDLSITILLCVVLLSAQHGQIVSQNLLLIYTPLEDCITGHYSFSCEQMFPCFEIII